MDSMYEYRDNELGYMDSCIECGQDTDWVPVTFGPRRKPNPNEGLIAAAYDAMIREQLEAPLLMDKFFKRD